MSVLTQGVRRGLRVVAAIGPLRERLRIASLEGRLPDPLWKRLPVELGFEVQYDGLRFQYQSTAYDAIGRQLYWKGVQRWEYETTSRFALLARRAELTLDIGANTGMYSLIACAANPLGRVKAFEPVPRLRARLEENLESNGFQHRAQVSAQAVSSAPGQARFHVPHQAMPTSASLHEDGFRGMDGEHIDVEVTTADHAVDETERVDLVKIDVEGFEPEVLQGMSRILSRDRPIIVLECNPDGPSTALEEALRPHGYGFYHLQEDQMVQTSGIAPDQQGHCRNFLCVHPDREDWLREL